MKDKFIPKIQLRAEIGETKFNTSMPARLENTGKTKEIPQFSEVFEGLVKEVDTTMKAPDQMLEDAILGQGADIHDVMLAISKAEVSLNVTTQMTTKVLQAYEKVIAIQV